jgi:alpha-1,6-mannosyltransferase
MASRLPSHRSLWRRLGAPAALLLLPLAALTALHDLSGAPGAASALLALSFCGWALTLHRVAGVAVGAVVVLGLALVLRLLMLPLAPTLSSDVWRYLWDGRVVRHGFDPYALAPEAEELVPLRDELWRRLEHRQVATVYPPAALAAFSIAAATPAPLAAWKLLVAGADLAVCWGVLWIARRRGCPWRAVAYAWNPMVALEGAGMGHLEPLAVAATVAAVALLLAWRPRPGWVASAVAAGAAIKLAPLAALPMWARQSGRPRTLLPLAVMLCAVLLAPMALSTRGLPSGIARYALHWEHGGAVYEPLWRLLALVGAPAVIHGALDHAKALMGGHELWNPLYPWIYPQMLARLVLAAAALGVVVRSVACRDPVAGSRFLFGGLLLCSPTLYPWYLLWVLPWAAVTASLAWWWASGAILLGYLPGLIGVPAWPWLHLAIWGPFAALWLWQRRGEGGAAAGEED